MRNTKYENKGFSLIEVLISVVILAFASVFLYYGFFSSLNASEHVKNRLYAGILISEMDFDVKKEISKRTDMQPGSFTINQKETVNEREFKCNASVASDTANPLRYKAVIVVGWREGMKSKNIAKEYIIKKTSVNNESFS